MENTVGVLQYLIVPETQDKVAATLQIFCPHRVLLVAVCVLAAVDFQNKLPIGATEIDNGATEIDNKSIQRHLTPELPAVEAPIAQAKPKDSLIRLIPSQTTRCFYC